MTASALRALIAAEIEKDNDKQLLQAYLVRKGPLLHHSIRLKGQHQSDKLYRFMLTYTRHAPDLLFDVRKSASRKSVDTLVEPFLTAAETFFLVPPPQASAVDGMLKMAACAYLCHRLVEELNDICHMCLGVVLWDHDLTHANLLVHAILGDGNANKLDDVVSIYIHALTQQKEGLFSNPAFLDMQAKYQERTDCAVA